MDPIVDLAPGAEDNDLAVRLAARVRSNLARAPRKVKDFRALRGTVQVVALDAGSALTLRFDHGRLTVHDGTIGVPAVTFSGDTAALLRLVDVPLSRWLSIPFASAGRGAREILSLLSRGELKIYGLASHPRLVTRVLRLVSPDG